MFGGLVGSGDGRYISSASSIWVAMCRIGFILNEFASPWDMKLEFGSKEKNLIRGVGIDPWNCMDRSKVGHLQSEEVGSIQWN